MLKKMNIRTKFLLAFLIMSTIPFGLISLISLINSSRALSTVAFGQLESMREVKKARIKFFFDERKADMENIMQTAATLRQSAFEKLSTVQEIKKAQIEEYFQKSMADLSVISRNSSVARALGDFASVFDEKGDIDEGLYNFFETVKYGDFLRQFKNEYGYHDLMLITKHGRIVYTLNREQDLGQNVASGNLKNSALDRYFQKELNKPTLYDFELYAPSGNKYMFFICAPVIQYSETVGVIALKLDKKDVNTIAQRRKGMRETGETFLAGKSHGRISYRSDQVVGQGKIGEYISDNHIERALSGNPGSVVKKGSTDDMEIVRYDPLNIPGLNWAMVSTMSLEEVIAPRLEGEQEDYFAKYIRNYGYNDLFLIHPGVMFFTRYPIKLITVLMC
ncbi:MAG: hypothetical protein GY749_17695 [Desulfobacteraceae bacterium]|nr:hypothetical protein [Desulfobacteraceae bacterium]